MHLALQNYDAALSAAEKAIALGLSKIRIDPFTRETLNLLKDAYELKIAVARSKRAADPDDAAPYFTLAEGTRDLSDITRRIELLQAREYLLEALNNDSKRNEWRLLLAQINLELGGLQDALQEVNRILEDDPAHEAAAQLKQIIQEQFRGE
jgi:tetratricopeptide (TPR) repeat protein